MYIQEFSIDNYGLFSSQKVENIPAGLTIVLGKNEAGKSTLLHYLRCMICGIPNNRGASEYKRIPCIDGGFSGSMLVSTASRVLEIRRKYRIEGRKENEVLLYTHDGNQVDYSLWLTALGVGIDLEIYRNIFGISLSELVELTKDEQRIKDMLYGASIGIGMKAPSIILEEIEEKSKKIYIPRGSKTALINTALVEREKVEAEHAECLQIMEEYESLQYKLTLLNEEQANLEETIQQQKHIVQVAKETEKGYGLWKMITILPENASETSLLFTQEIRDELIANDTRYIELQSDVEEKKKHIAEKEQEIANIQCIHDILSHEEVFQTIERKLSQYEHALEEHESLEHTLTHVGKEIDYALAELDSSYTREHISSLSIHFALEQEIASIKAEIASNTNIAFHKEESIKELRRAIDDIERKTTLNAEEEIYHNEYMKLEHTLHAISEKQRSIEQRKQAIENIKHTIGQTLHSIPSIEWSEQNARHNMNAMKFEHTIMLKRHVEIYNEAIEKKGQSKEQQKEVETYINVKEREQRILRDTLFEHSHAHSITDLEKLEHIETLLHAQEKLEHQSIRTTHIIRSVLVFVLCMGITFLCFSLLPSIVLLQWLTLVVGTVLSGTCSYALYRMERKIEQYSTFQQIRHISSGTLSTPFEIESHIDTLKRDIGLTGLTQEERLYHREKILRYIDIEKKAIALQKECEREKQQLAMLLTEYEAHIDNIRILEKQWDSILQELYLPSIPIRMESVDMMLHLRKRTDLLLQEEQRIYTLVEEENKNLELLFSSLQEIAIVQSMQHDTTFYTQELMVERCTQSLMMLQEKRQQHILLQKEKNVLEEKLIALQKEYENVQLTTIQERWHTWLEQSRFPIFLTPDTIESFIQRVSAIKEKITREEQLEEQKHICSTKIEQFESIVKRLLATLPQRYVLDIYTLPILHIARSLLTLFTKEKEQLTILRGLEQERAIQANTIAELEARMIKIQHRCEDILKRSSCSTKEEFFRQYALHEERMQKKKERESYIHSLLQLVYPRSFEEIRALFTQCTETELHETVLTEEKILEELELKRSQYMEESGKIKEKLEQAEHGDISKYALQHTMLTAKIEEAMKEWYTLNVAKEIIVQAQKQFEDKYQPEVMRIAGDILGTITCGTWNRIVRSVDNSIKVRNNSGIEKLPEALSRGTQEQMYLALRFAGACTHSMKTKEALPILLDDITVNFDYERTVGVAHAIKNITSGLYNGIPKHQIFLFTCHETVVETVLDIMPDAKLLHMDQGYISVN